MALDYSTLSDAELEAIANDDYSKLSDATLQAMAAEGPQPDLGKTLGEYSFGETAKAIAKPGVGVAGTVADLAAEGWANLPYKELLVPYAGWKAAPHVWQGAKQGAQIMKNFVGGSGVATPPPVAPVAPNPAVSPSWAGGAAPEAAAATSMMTNLTPAMIMGAPYALAGMEAANIRRYPNAPGYKDVPYAQMYRKEAPTQNVAGETNRMKALANMPFTGVNAQERAILEQDRMMRQNIRKKAYEKVMGPVAPGSF